MTKEVSSIAAHATSEEKTAVEDAFLRLGSKKVEVMGGYQELLVVLKLKGIMSATRLKRATGSLVHERKLWVSRGNDEPMRNSYERRPFIFGLVAKTPVEASATSS